MSDINNKTGFISNFKHDQFLYFAARSHLGIIVIQRGYLIYYNEKFERIFGYSHEEIASWKKFEYFKIIHPDDVPLLLERMKVEDEKNVSVHFRGVKKNGDIIPIENYITQITYNNKIVYLCSYDTLENIFYSIEIENDSPSNYSMTINLPHEIFEEIDLISRLQGKKINAFIKDELIKVLHFYIEDCKRLLG